MSSEKRMPRLRDDEASEIEKLLLASAADDEMPEGVAAAWTAEAERRLREIEAGRVKPIPASEVHAKLRDKFGLGR